MPAMINIADKSIRIKRSIIFTIVADLAQFFGVTCLVCRHRQWFRFCSINRWLDDSESARITVDLSPVDGMSLGDGGRANVSVSAVF